MKIDEIKQYLPHRYPFLLVDRVEELVIGEEITAYKNITTNEQVFEGHFPHYPVFPGVMIVEALAQASGILGFKTLGKRPEDGSLYLFAGVEKAKFKRQVVPGDKLVLKSKVHKRMRNLWKFDCTAYVDGEVACTAMISCIDHKVSE